MMLVWLGLAGPSLAQSAAVIQGAGASFPAPLIWRWAAEYRARTGIEVRYASIGSGAGVARATAGQVDFGVTDRPLSEDELRQHALDQIPFAVGGVVPVFNVSGIASDALRLDGPTLADIYLGRIRHWNDPRLQALNPGLNLPAANITVVHRSDASGTSHLFSRFLALHSEDWRRQAGADPLTPAWPVGTGGRGNEGVASLVQRTRMALGYVEFAYAHTHHLQTARVRNHDGVDLAASRQAFEAAAAGVRWANPVDQRRSLINAPGAASWPLTGASFLLLPRPTGGVPSAAAAFFHWALREGADQALALDFMPLPTAIPGL